MCESWSQVHDTASPRGLHFWSNNAQFGDPVGSFPVQQGPGGVVRRNNEWSNDEFDKHTEILFNADNLEERKAAFRRMLEIAEREDPSYLTLCQAAQFYGKRKEFDWTAAFELTLDFRGDNLTFPS
jgi:peptide/nickel transport system substrate-binding protein